MKFMLFTEIFSNALELMVNKFILGIPNLIIAIILTIIGVYVSKFISKLIKVALTKANIDKYGEKLNEIEIVSKFGKEIKLSSILSKLLYYFMLLFFLVAATDVLQMQALSELVMNTIELIPHIVVAIIVLVVGLLAAEALRKTVITACDSLGIPSGKVISMFVFYFVFITVFIMALSQVKINTEFLAQNISIIIGGAVFAFSLGYGLASKDVVSNFLASHYSKDRVKLGDTVTFQGVRGKIVDLDKSSVTIEGGSSKVVIPISKLLSDNIEIHN